MAVDTRRKRFSMLGFSHMDDVLTDPATSGIQETERADILNLYHGITLDDPVADTGPGSYINRLLDRGRNHRANTL